MCHASWGKGWITLSAWWNGLMLKFPTGLWDTFSISTPLCQLLCMGLRCRVIRVCVFLSKKSMMRLQQKFTDCESVKKEEEDRRRRGGIRETEIGKIGETVGWGLVIVVICIWIFHWHSQDPPPMRHFLCYLSIVELFFHPIQTCSWWKTTRAQITCLEYADKKI